jgi:hypothetical protein
MAAVAISSECVQGGREGEKQTVCYMYPSVSPSPSDIFNLISGTIKTYLLHNL